MLSTHNFWALFQESRSCVAVTRVAERPLATGIQFRGALWNMNASGTSLPPAFFAELDSRGEGGASFPACATPLYHVVCTRRAGLAFLRVPRPFIILSAHAARGLTSLRAPRPCIILCAHTVRSFVA